MTLLGNVPTFFYFGITLLPLKKKVLQTSRPISQISDLRNCFAPDLPGPVQPFSAL